MTLICTALLALTASTGLKSGDTVVFCGDSITCLGQHNAYGFRHQLTNALAQTSGSAKGVSCVNLGFCGNGVKNNWLSIERNSRIRPVQADAHSRAYPEESVNATFSNRVDVLVLCLGMNDILAPYFTDTPESFADWRACYAELVRNLKARVHPRVMVLGTVPPLTNDPQGPKNLFSSRMDDEIRRIAADEGALVVDYKAALFRALGRIRRISPDYQDTPDFVHPCELGNIAMAAELCHTLGETSAADFLKRRFQARLVELVKPADKAISYRIFPLGLEDPDARERSYRIEWTRLADGRSGSTVVKTVPDRAVNAVTVEGERIDLPAPWRVSAPFTGEKRPSEIAAWRLTSGTFDYLGGVDSGSVDYMQAWFGEAEDSFYACRGIYSGRDRDLPYEFRTAAFSNTYDFRVELNGALVSTNALPRGTQVAPGGVLKLNKGWNDLVIRCGHRQWQRQFSFRFLPPADDDLSDIRYDWTAGRTGIMSARRGQGKAASYWCTWETQNYTIDPDRQVKTLGFVGDQGAQGARDNIDEEVLFGKDGKGGWVEACLPETRKGLYFLIDDGWDVPYLQAPGKDVSVFGSLVVDTKRFPSFTGTPAERLAKFNAAVKARGWKGLALWCATQCTGESWGGKGRPGVNFDDAAVEKAWRERFRWCHEAGIGYLKFDWGARSGQVEFRRLLSRIAREVAPEILIEHCTGAVPLNEPERMFGNPAYDENRAKAKELMGFADLFRIYDLLNPFVYATAAERCAFYLEVQAEAGGRCLLSTEDEIYLGASLGCAFGVMRSPFLPDERCPIRLQGRRMTEVDRAVAWQRLAPPFASAEKPRISKTTLADSWTYPSGSTWYRKAEGHVVVQKAPAVLSRGLELPVVTSAEADGSVPFVTACRYPNGLVSVGCIPRMAENSGIRTPKADVALAVAAPKIAVFGTIGSLTVPDGAGRVLARDLADGTAEDLTAKCVRTDGRLRIPGDELNRIGTARNGVRDLSDPGVLIDFRGF